MPGLGTIVNAAAIILGGLAGLLFGKLIKPRVQETIMTACGVCVLFLGIGGAMGKMLTSAADGTLSSGGTMMLIASVVLGGLVGALLNIEGAMERGRRRLCRRIRDGFADGVHRRDGGGGLHSGRNSRGSLNAFRKGDTRPCYNPRDDCWQRKGLHFLGNSRGCLSGDYHRAVKASEADNDTCCAE